MSASGGEGELTAYLVLHVLWDKDLAYCTIAQYAYLTYRCFLNDPSSTLHLASACNSPRNMTVALSWTRCALKGEENWIRSRLETLSDGAATVVYRAVGATIY